MRRTATDLLLFLISFALILGLSTAPALAASDVSLQMDAPLPVSPTFSEKKLENGLTYYVRSNPEPENRARLILVVKAGRVQEEDNQIGAAHLVEHMAFNGTRNFPGKEIDRFMERAGMGTCECYSGYTTFTETVYSFWLPTDDIKVLDRGLQVLSDIASEVSFVPDEVERERGVILEEWREDKGHARENSIKMQELLYGGSRYAERLDSNESSPVEGISRDTLVEFYRQWYRPELMAVIVVGDFDEKKMDRLVRKRFSKLKNPKDAPEWKAYDVPDRETTDYMVVTDPDIHTLSLAVSNFHDWAQPKTVGDERRDMALGLFTSMLNYRLSARLFEKDPPYLGARVSYGRSIGNKASFSISASSEKGEMEKALRAVLYELGRAMQLGFTATELERNKTSILKSADDIEAEGYKSYTSEVSSELMRHFLEDEPVPGYENEVALIRGITPLVTLDEINSLGRGLMAKNVWLMLGSAPEGGEALVPDKDAVAAMLAGAGSIEVAEYVDKVSEDELMPVLPTPGEVVSTKKFEKFDYTEWKLSNGTTVVLKPTDFEKTEVLFSAYSEGGSSLASDADFYTATLSTLIVRSGGLGSFDALSLGKKLTGKSISITPFIDELDEGFAGSSTPEDIETMFELLYMYFTAERKDEVVFDTIKKRLAMAVDIAAKQPEKALADAMVEVLYNNHPRRVPLDAEKVAALDLDTALRFYRDRFSDAGDFTFFLVGSFDPDKVKPLVETYIGGLPSTGRQETWRDIGVELPKGVIKREVRTGTGDKATVALIFTGDFEWSEKNALDLDVAASVLENMLTETLREDLSGTYGVNVSSSSGRYPRPDYSISVTFNCSPDRVEELKAEVFKSIDKLKGGEDLGKYIEPIIKKGLKAYENRLDDNSYWLGVLSYLYRNDMRPEDYVSSKNLLGDVEPGAVAESARKHFNMENYVDVVYYSGT